MKADSWSQDTSPDNSTAARYSLLVANSGPTGKNQIFTLSFEIVGIFHFFYPGPVRIVAHTEQWPTASRGPQTDFNTIVAESVVEPSER